MPDTTLWAHDAVASKYLTDTVERGTSYTGMSQTYKAMSAAYVGGDECKVLPAEKELRHWGYCQRPEGHDGPHVNYSGDTPVMIWATGLSQRTGFMPIYHYVHPRHREGLPEDLAIEYKDEPPWTKRDEHDPACGDEDPSGKFICTRKPGHRGAHEHYVNVVLLASWSWRKVEAA